MKYTPLLAAVLFLGGCAATRTDGGPQSDPFFSTVPSYRAVPYTCKDGRKFTVRYLNNGGKHVAILPAGQSSDLWFHGTGSASGARYEAGSYVWWAKGRSATLFEHGDEGRPGAGLACEQD